MKSPPNLLELQNWLHDIVTDPRGVSDSLPEVSQAPHISFVNDSSPGAIHRLSIYAEAYYLRILECLGKDFKETKKILGDELFAKLVVDYLKIYPSKYTSIDEVGCHLPVFLLNYELVIQEYPWVPDVAQFEWMQLESFYAEDSTDTDSQWFHKISGEDLSQRQFKTQSALRLLRSNWEFHRSMKGEVTHVESKKCFFIIYRFRDVVFWEELNESFFNILTCLNTIGTNTINATLEAAAKVNSPVIIQFSNGGAQFIAGKGMQNDHLQANIAGGISGALHIHNVAKYYGVPVVLHTDHASKKWLPWISGLVDAGEQFYKEKGQPLFSSHMLDLSEEPIEENIATSVEFYKRMAPLGMSIEIELGVTGGEEDGVDNSDVDNEKLYTQPEHVAYSYKELSKVGNLFTIAAAFGNVHGVYKSGNVQLTPVILKNSQDYIEKEFKTATLANACAEFFLPSSIA